MYERILVVCTGNICRSPIAEYLLRDFLIKAGRTPEVRSAGVDALVGERADDVAITLISARGIDLAPHVAQQATQALCRWAELVLVMETHHRNALVEIDPTVRGKTFLLGHWKREEISDPYRHDLSVWEEVVRQIDNGVAEWGRRL